MKTSVLGISCQNQFRSHKVGVDMYNSKRCLVKTMWLLILRDPVEYMHIWTQNLFLVHISKVISLLLCLWCFLYYSHGWSATENLFLLFLLKSDMHQKHIFQGRKNVILLWTDTCSFNISPVPHSLFTVLWHRGSQMQQRYTEESVTFENLEVLLSNNILTMNENPSHSLDLVEQEMTSLNRRRPRKNVNFNRFLQQIPCEEMPEEDSKRKQNWYTVRFVASTVWDWCKGERNEVFFSHFISAFWQNSFRVRH